MLANEITSPSTMRNDPANAIQNCGPALFTWNDNNNNIKYNNNFGSRVYINYDYKMYIIHIYNSKLLHNSVIIVIVM